MTVDDQITAVRAKAIEIPLARMMRNARGVVGSQALVLIEIESRRGIIGCAYLRCYTRRAAKALCVLVEEAGQCVHGAAIDTVRVKEALESEFALIGFHGLVGMAMAGIDIALWDAAGQAVGAPLWRLLDREDTSIRAYRPLASMEPKEAAVEAEAAAKAGFEGVKLKLGGSTLSSDLSALRAVRSAIGWELAVMVDYNQSLSRSEARLRLAAIADMKPFWVEEPLNADDHVGCAELRMTSPVPIQVGENCWGAADVTDAGGGADFVAFDAARVGGVSGWLQALNSLPAHCHAVSNHAYCEIAAHLLGSSKKGDWMEWMADVAPLLQTPLQVSRGRVLRPSGSGLGLAWSKDAVARRES